MEAVKSKMRQEAWDPVEPMVQMKSEGSASEEVSLSHGSQSLQSTQAFNLLDEAALTFEGKLLTRCPPI